MVTWHMVVFALINIAFEWLVSGIVRWWVQTKKAVFYGDVVNSCHFHKILVVFAFVRSSCQKGGTMIGQDVTTLFAFEGFVMYVVR